MHSLEMLLAKLCLGACLFAMLVGCAGSGSTSSSTTTGGGGGSPVSITVTTPNGTLGLRVGTGSFTAVTSVNNQLTFQVPSATAQYALAWGCEFGEPPNETIYAVVLQATPQDGTNYSAPCTESVPTSLPSTAPAPTPTPATVGTVTANFDVSAIPNAGIIFVTGGNGVISAGSSLPGAYSQTWPAGTYDVALSVFDPNDVVSGHVLAERILRNQTVPGTLNGGNTIVFGPGDVPVPQPLSIPSAPPGFSTPVLPDPRYITTNTSNTGVALDASGASTSQYLAVPPASTQSGDKYVFSLQSGNGTSIIGLTQIFTNGGGPVTIEPLPTPWSYSGPAPAALPTFVFDSYQGFSGQPSWEGASIGWSVSSPTTNIGYSINVFATASYVNGASTPITIPNLSLVPGLTSAFWVQRPQPSGSSVFWSAIIGTNSNSFVSDSGSFTVP